MDVCGWTVCASLGFISELLCLTVYYIAGFFSMLLSVCLVQNSSSSSTPSCICMTYLVCFHLAWSISVSLSCCQFLSSFFLFCWFKCSLCYSSVWTEMEVFSLWAVVKQPRLGPSLFSLRQVFVFSANYLITWFHWFLCDRDWDVFGAAAVVLTCFGFSHLWEMLLESSRVRKASLGTRAHVVTERRGGDAAVVVKVM